MGKSRRDFLKTAGCAALGFGSAFPLLRAVASAREGGSAHSAETATRQWGLVIDIQKCLRDEIRRACEEACAREHNVPAIPDPQEEVKWIWSEAYERAFPDIVHSRTTPHVVETPVLVLCNHCTNPPCVKVCPTQATWKRESDGIVMMDMHRCIGCRYCMAGCPYGARSFNWRDPRPYIAKGSQSLFPTRTAGVVEKCNFCAERVRDGLEPACVVAARDVPGGEGALTFGDLSDPRSEVSRLLRDHDTICRKVSVGTGPNVFYIV